MSATLEELCSIIVDCEHKTSPIDATGEYFAVGTPAMRGNVIDYSQARRISRETFERWTRRLRPAKGDLLFAREAPVGPIVSIPETENVAPGQRTVLMRVNPAIADSTFIFYLLSSPLEQARIQSLAAGSTVAHLNVADIRSFEVDLPNLEDQIAIAEVLGALDDKIAANTKLAATATELVQAEFQRLSKFAGQETTIGEILSLEYGKSLAATNRVPGEVDVFGSGGIVGKHDTALLKGPGVVVGRKGTAGAVHWSAGPYFPIDTTYYAVPRSEEVSQLLAYFFLKSVRLNEMNSDSAVPGLNRNEAHAARVKLPAAEDLRAFTGAMNPVFDSASQTQKENQALAATRDALLPQLMSGKLRVKDAESLVSAVV